MTYKIPATSRASQIEYAIRDVVVPASKLESEGANILKLNIGDPLAYAGLPTPDHMIEAYKKALVDQKNGYSPAYGINELREAIATDERNKTNGGWNCDPDDVYICHGVTEALQLLFAAFLNKDDEVLAPGPHYPPYLAYPQLYGGKTIEYRLDPNNQWSIDFEDLDSKKEQAITKISGSLKVKGFRPGKIPKNIVIREVGEDYILEEAVDLYLPEQIFDILQKEEINPAVRPVVKDLKKEKKSFKVDVLITLWPTLSKLPKLNQKVEVESITPTEEEINEQIERIKLQFGEVEKVERPSKASDYLLVNISSIENGTEVKEFNYQDYLYELGSNTLTPAMDLKLEGVSSGAIIKFNDDIPTLDKSNVEITVLVKEIKQKVMPELTDEWVSSVTEFDTVVEMNEEIVKNIEDAKKRQVANQYQGLLTSKIIDESKLELPEQLIIAEMDSILQNFMNELKQNNIKIEDYLKITGLTEETLQEDLKNQATRNLSMVVILDKVAEDENLKLDEKEVQYIDEYIGTLDEGDQVEAASRRLNLESESLRNKAMIHVLKQGVSVDANGEKVYLQDVYNQEQEIREEE